jgi:rubrerythrin
MTKYFKKRLNAMLSDEKIAPKDYSKLSHATSNKTIKRQIRAIQSDERKHYRILKGIKRRWM